MHIFLWKFTTYKEDFLRYGFLFVSKLIPLFFNLFTKEVKNMNGLQRTALALIVIGGINWGLIGFFQFDLIAAIFGGQSAVISRIIYDIVGISALYCLTLLFKPSKEFRTEPHRQYD